MTAEELAEKLGYLAADERDSEPMGKRLRPYAEAFLAMREACEEWSRNDGEGCRCSMCRALIQAEALLK